MACICQYFVTSRNRTDSLFSNETTSVQPPLSNGDDANSSEQKAIQNLASVEVSASQLVAAKAEIWVLKKNLADAQVNIENLENLVKTIINKQNELLIDIYDIKRQNVEMQNECRLQRDYQTMERNSLMREIHNIKTVLGERTKLVEDTVLKNTELTNALQDANEKIYLMGMKFLKLKSSQAKHASDHSSSNSEKSN